MFKTRLETVRARFSRDCGVWFGAAAALRGIVYWVAAWVRNPYEPLTASMLYRVGDIEDFPVLGALVRSRFADPVLFEPAGRPWSYPALPLIPHALALKWAGPAGLVLADAAAAVLFYAVLAALLRALGVSRVIAFFAAAAAVVVSKPPAPGEAIAYVNYFIVNFWGWRLPRPFVSDIFYVAALWTAALLFVPRGAFRRKRIWIGFGIALAAAAQCQIYPALGAALAFSVLGWSLYAFHPQERAGFLSGVALAAAALLCGMAPFLIQRASEIPDFARRAGVFDVPRAHPFWIPLTAHDVVWLAYLGIASFFLARFYRERGEAGRPRAFIFLGALTAGAYLALPVSCALLGKTAQPYHFRFEFQRVLSLDAFVFAVLCAELFFEYAPRAAKAAAVIFMIFAAGTAWVWADGYARYGGHMRAGEWTGYAEYRALPSYRKDFSELIRELSDPEYAGCRVLGTLDPQVASWWALFGGGYLYLPDAVVTAAADTEIEARFVSFCKLLRMPESSFRERIRRPATLVFWLGHDKYQASQAHAFAPPGDYEPAARRRRTESGIFDSWSVALPLSEEERLVRAYTAAPDAPGARRLDLVILLKKEAAAPSNPDFRKVFSNGTFELWRRP